MATDSPEVSPHSSSHSSQPRHFYVAVDRLQFKMDTLVDLLGVAGRQSGLPVALCCSSRDDLDAVCSAISNLDLISVSSLYSDLNEADRTSIIEKFRQATMRWNQIRADRSADSVFEKEEHKSHMIVVTDACLPLPDSGESPILARVLINYELPNKKETYMRRIITCLAADGIVINMVAGGEIMTLKSIEESSIVIDEMPINVSLFHLGMITCEGW